MGIICVPSNTLQRAQAKLAPSNTCTCNTEDPLLFFQNRILNREWTNIIRKNVSKKKKNYFFYLTLLVASVLIYLTFDTCHRNNTRILGIYYVSISRTGLIYEYYFILRQSGRTYVIYSFSNLA
jgi:hypothetical protein